jgi:hypothetical protein
MSTRIFLFTAFVLACLAGPAQATTEPRCAGPGAADGYARRNGADVLEFDVLRNGKRVGLHRTRFARENGYLVVSSEMEVTIRFLMIAAYRYRYTATEYWCEGQLVRLDATVDDNGDRSRFKARAKGARIEIDGSTGRASAPLGLISTNHWHSGVLEARAVLNTLTGRVNQVRLERCPPATAEGPAGTDCYDYTGDLDARVWYDAAGRWVGLAFDGKDGSRFLYRCRRCAAPVNAS